MRARVAVAVGLALAPIAACSLTHDLDALSSVLADAAAPGDDATSASDGGGGADATTDDVTIADGNADANDSAASDGAPTDARNDTSPAACPAIAPAMVRVPAAAGGFCIDSTEVTNAQYTAFLNAAGAVPTGLPAYCSWKTSLVPGTSTLTWPRSLSEANYPVMAVDWCDAYAYCKWAGKRLCGKPGGGSSSPANFVVAGQSQWFAACSQNGAQAYPYGTTAQTTACNTRENNGDAGTLANVGSFPSCVGGYPGIDDLAGNVEEWEDSCDFYTPDASDNCRLRGGAADDTAAAASCANDNTHTRNYRSLHKGFRCCAD